MTFSLRFDMRAPSFGAPVDELYQAALNMCGWAEDHGCLAAVVCEHHASPDGYLPTPLILASAIAARTRSLAINAVVILPLYDAVRLVAAGEMLNLSPLCGGLPPDQAWPYLKRVAEQVIPQATATEAARQGPDLGGALSTMTSRPTS